MLHAAVELGRRNATCQLENWVENDDGNQLAMGTNWSFGSFMSTEERGKSGAKAGQNQGEIRANFGQFQNLRILLISTTTTATTATTATTMMMKLGI